MLKSKKEHVYSPGLGPQQSQKRFHKSTMAMLLLTIPSPLLKPLPALNHRLTYRTPRPCFLLLPGSTFHTYLKVKALQWTSALCLPFQFPFSYPPPQPLCSILFNFLTVPQPTRHTSTSETTPFLSPGNTRGGRGDSKDQCRSKEMKKN